MALTLTLLLVALCGRCQAATARVTAIDTDIGTDFDDSWAIALSLRATALDVQLIVTATLDTVARARVTAKYLTLWQRTDVALGIGVRTSAACGALCPWAADVDLARGERLLVLAIAPFTNLRALDERFPGDLDAIDVVAMGGAFFRCYAPIQANNCPEYNMYEDVASAQATFNRPWRAGAFKLLPLDTTEWRLPDAQWQELRAHNNSKNVMVQSLLETYCYWLGTSECLERSDVLYDPTAALVAAQLAVESIVWDDLPFVVDEKGRTVFNVTVGHWFSVGVRYRSPSAFADFASHVNKLLLA